MIEIIGSGLGVGGVLRRRGARGIRNMPLHLSHRVGIQGMPWENRFKHKPRGTEDVKV